TTDIGSKDATRLLVTGTTGITSFGVVANSYKILRFQGIVTITNSANIILIGGTNRVTAAGDVMWMTSDNTGKWRELMFTAASGVPLGVPDSSDTVKGIIEIATQAEVDAGTDTVRAIVPATLSVRLAALTTAITDTLRAGVSATLDTFAEVATALGTLAPKANATMTGTTDCETVNTDALVVNASLTLPAGSVELGDLEAKAKPYLNALHVQDQQTSGTTGQSITANTFTKRQCTAITNTLSASVSSSVIVLPAGDYYVEGYTVVGVNIDVGAGGTTAGRFGARLRNTTAGTTLLRANGDSITGSDSGSGGNDLMNKIFIMRGFITVAASQNLEIQTFCSSLTNVTVNGGQPITSGDSEVYTDMIFLKIG